MRTGTDEAPLVSVIVPAHNSSGTLRKCLESLLAQTYRNLEVVIVANACSDATAAIATAFAARDSRVRVLQTDVPGVSHARNMGLDAVSGCFVGFADADDWIEPGMFGAMVRVAVSMSADVVCSGRVIETKRGISHISASERVAEIDADEFYRGVLLDPYGGSVCNKLFSRKALDSRRFDEGMAIIEDSAFCCALASSSLRFVTIPGCYYHYVDNDGNATSDLARLVTSNRKWAYLEGSLNIQAKAANETQKRISDEANCAFAAPGVRQLAGLERYEDVFLSLRRYLLAHFWTYVRCEGKSSMVAKTCLAMAAPGLWRTLANRSR